jgi:hypothetical protein
MSTQHSSEYNNSRLQGCHLTLPVLDPPLALQEYWEVARLVDLAPQLRQVVVSALHPPLGVLEALHRLKQEVGLVLWQDRLLLPMGVLLPRAHRSEVGLPLLELLGGDCDSGVS